MENTETHNRGLLGCSVEVKGFSSFEKIEITADSLREASLELGRKIKRPTVELLSYKRKDANFDDSLEKASKSLQKLKDLSDKYSEVFTTPDGANHLKIYIDTLESFCEGAGITIDEGALLQIEDQAGCETLIVQNAETGEIAAIHTEEDSDEFSRSGNPARGKRWIDMKIGEREVQFCSYAGICSWGSASGIVQEKGRSFFQASDIIDPCVKGDLWANAVVFMFMDVANLNDIKVMAERMKGLPKPIFDSGYVVHMIEGDSKSFLTLEFGGDEVNFVDPVMSSERAIQIGDNYPRTLSLQAIDGYNLPQQASETNEDYEKRQKEKWAMERRTRRLVKIGQMAGRGRTGQWGRDNVLGIAKKVMNSPHGDVVDEWFTGLSNDLVAQHDLLYVSPEGQMSLIVRRGFPKLRSKK